jgi:hypothetical protein
MSLKIENAKSISKVKNQVDTSCYNEESNEQEIRELNEPKG